MKKALKKYLIPHKDNDYKPHLFREATLAVMLGAIVLLFASSIGTTLVVKKTNLLGNIYSAVLVDLTNQSRASNNQPVLVVNPVLQTVAQMKANDMAAKSYFAHTSPEGLTPWYWFKKAGYVFSYAGENLAVNFKETQDVENALLASPTHRANILDPHFTEIGIATAEGVYKGNTTTFVVESFGKPKPSKLPVKTALPASSLPVASAITTQPTNTDVKGESIEDDTSVELVSETDDSIVVKSTEPETEESTAVSSSQEPSHQSTWLQHIFVNQPHVVEIAYKIMMGILALGLLLFIFIEMRVQHPRQVMYGILVLVLLIGLFYINHSLILTDSLLL